MQAILFREIDWQCGPIVWQLPLDRSGCGPGFAEDSDSAPYDGPPTGADTPAVADVAQEKSKWAVTYDHPNSCTVERCLTAPYWIWGPEYVRIAEQVKAKTYKAGYEYFDAESKAMGLVGFMDGQTVTKGVSDLPAADVQKVRDTLAKMLAGQFGRFDVFAGPIKDNTGKEILAAGTKLKQSDLDQFPPGAPLNKCSVCMYWWSDGITVPLPKLGS